ncbi:HAD-IIB family hydrolase [Sinisalibacter lacisalsi]|uniref:Mannosyl-3-phosphoglycerate phosphatase n=1 Tax=Sinisalibacter lacisalsi TaxID=1526570 RepID=A0ABQ1QU07_9RHOB|nr:HAD-IIB family hydrolase [Sinisalibacter lacisalsi]GGD46214.1 mannosyl-3-phosphoglycerate phosphatase [Sinisalibacter lacisalsi]
MKTFAPQPVPLLVFSDLDGTLLDHAGYGHAPARPALAALRARGVPLVLASSKTAAEIAPLQADLGLDPAPAIVENGAGVIWPEAAPGEDDSAYRRLRAALARLPGPLRAGFTGFGDMSAAEVANLTGLSPDAAARAKARAHSEPGLWRGAAAGRRAFCAALAEQGITVQAGGRFLTLGFGGSKAERMAEIAAAYGTPRTLALGDAPNDIGMLEAADHGVIIRNDHGPGLPPLAGEATGRITRSTLPGPEGWNAAVLDFLSTHDPKGKG